MKERTRLTTQFGYTGKVAFVTGGGTGIGLATAIAKAGASGAIAGLPEACLINTEEWAPLETKGCGIFRS